MLLDKFLLNTKINLHENGMNKNTNFHKNTDQDMI